MSNIVMVRVGLFLRPNGHASLQVGRISPASRCLAQRARLRMSNLPLTSAGDIRQVTFFLQPDFSIARSLLGEE
jgi:hypothetical protein